MAKSTSLGLLKGGKEAAAAPAPEPTVVEEEVSVDIDTMDSDQIDALVEEHKIAVPENWGDMDLAGKKEYLNNAFGEDGGEPDAPADPTPAPSTSPAPVEKKAVEAEPVDQGAPADPEAAKAADKAAKAAAKKAKSAAKSSTALTTSNTLNGEVIGPNDDLLHTIVKSIETLGQEEALKMVSKLAEDADQSYFKLGGVLALIQTNSWYEPYASFREFVENAHGIHYRTATYWTAIYNALVESGVQWSQVKAVSWTKLKEIAGILTKENVEEWVKLALENNTITLHELVKSKKAGQSAAITDGTSQVTTKTFKVHAGQKEVIEAAIDKAKETNNTDVDTVALEAICQDYLGSMSLTDRVKAAGLEAAATAFQNAFPHLNITIEDPTDAAA